MAATSAELFRMARRGVDVKSVAANVRKPFRFYLCGDPALIASMRAFLLSGHDGVVPPEAASCLETLSSGQMMPKVARDSRAILFLGRRGDVSDATMAPLRSMKLPIFAITVGESDGGPSGPPAPGDYAEYAVSAIGKEPMRGRLLPHLVDRCKGVEIAVARCFPPLREAVAAKLTRDAANSALKIALASAVVDHIPVLGIVLGAVASAGDMVAITGIQMMLLLRIGAAYGQDPDVQRMWQLLPVVGGGFGWRMLARELAGFIPVAGIPIKGAIAYAGTIVVGEGVAFFHEHGRHMSSSEARSIYEGTKTEALHFARDFFRKFIQRS